MGQVGSSCKASPSLQRFQPASGKPPEAPDRGLRGTIRRTRVRVNFGLTAEIAFSYEPSEAEVRRLAAQNLAAA